MKLFSVQQNNTTHSGFESKLGSLFEFSIRAYLPICFYLAGDYTAIRNVALLRSGVMNRDVRSLTLGDTIPPKPTDQPKSAPRKLKRSQSDSIFLRSWDFNSVDKSSEVSYNSMLVLWRQSCHVLS